MSRQETFLKKHAVACIVDFWARSCKISTNASIPSVVSVLISNYSHLFYHFLNPSSKLSKQIQLPKNAKYNKNGSEITLFNTFDTAFGSFIVNKNEWDGDNYIFYLIFESNVR